MAEAVSSKPTTAIEVGGNSSRKGRSGISANGPADGLVGRNGYDSLPGIILAPALDPAIFAGIWRHRRRPAASTPDRTRRPAANQSLLAASIRLPEVG